MAKILQLILLIFPIYAYSADITGVYAMLLDPSVVSVWSDDAEHGLCPGPNYSSNVTCVDNSLGDIENVTTISRSGNNSYYLPGNKPSGWSVGDARQIIDTAKMSTGSDPFVAFDINQNPSRKAGFKVWYYVDSGFDDSAWKIQDQWKIQPDDDDWDALDFFNPHNPKISWGFYHNGAQRIVRVILRDIDDSVCGQTASYYYSTKEVPDQQWVFFRTEIFANTTDGYIKVWQMDDDESAETLIFNIQGVNTGTQYADPYHSSNVGRDVNLIASDHKCTSDQLYVKMDLNRYNYWNDNYLDTDSYATESQALHVLYVDDAEVYLIK